MDLLRRLFHREEAAASFCSAVIVAGGRASRMEGIDKILCPMGGEPLLLYTLMPFQTSSLVDEIVLVTREDLMVPIGTLCSQRGITKVRRVVKELDPDAFVIVTESNEVFGEGFKSLHEV